MKVGDRIFHKSKDARGNKYSGTIIKTHDYELPKPYNTHLIQWNRQMWNTGPKEPCLSWVHENEIALDIEQLRHRKLTELGIEL